jgi:tripartite-type tricarboxylate transporter receptor subunit TctC
MGNVLSSLQHARAGRLRALAVTTAKRSSAVPEVPTLAEAGVSGYECSTWHGWFAPAATSVGIVAKVSAELAKSAKSADVLARLQPDGAMPVGSSPEVLREFVVADIARWRKVVRDAGIKLE